MTILGRCVLTGSLLAPAVTAAVSHVQGGDGALLLPLLAVPLGAYVGFFTGKVIEGLRR